jgi:glycosyltransferase involved in cell wall biosynthesis
MNADTEPLEPIEPPRRKRISIVTPTYNEENNVDELCDRIRDVMETLPQYEWEHLFIDNASVDGTVDRIRARIAVDPRVGLIVNVRNFGHVRSPYYGIIEADGDAVISLASDLQDPPELLPRFLEGWEEGFKVVAGVKATAEEGFVIGAMRSTYYRLLAKIADVEVIQGFTGFGLYDRDVIVHMRELRDAYPYLRGVVSELGYPHKKVPFDKRARKAGRTSNNFFTLYDLAMLGFTSHSRVPLRIAAMTGFALSMLSGSVAGGYLAMKLLFWDNIPFGFAPLLIGVFFLGSLQLFFIGLVGEYLGVMYLNVLRRPLVVEKERLNWRPRIERADLPLTAGGSPDARRNS